MSKSEEILATQGPQSSREVPSSKNKSWVSLSYFAEGLPWSLLHQVSGEYFTAIGAPPSQVGRTALLHLPILLKVLFSPFVERFMTLRKWMLGTQAMMGVFMGGVAVLAQKRVEVADPASFESPWLWIALLSVGILSAIYDIACDGFYLENLTEKEQAQYSGLRVAIYRLAMLTGSFLLVFLGGRFNWLLSFGLGAGLLLGLSFALQLLLPNEESMGKGPRRSGEVLDLAVRNSYLSFLKQDSVGLVVAFLLSYKAADALMFSMSSVLLSRHLGIVTELRASLGVVSTVASIVGAMVGGAWVARKGLEKTLFPITFFMVTAQPLFLLLAFGKQDLVLSHNAQTLGMSGLELASDGPRLLLIGLVLGIEKLCAGLAVAAQTVFIMRRCHPSHKTAHYAFATVVYSIAQIVLGLVSGYAFEDLGPVGYYLLVSVVAIPALFLARVVPLGKRLA
jgi:MFS transporter, PAT family, beta-lactamase induction signal transducer AmpG